MFEFGLGTKVPFETLERLLYCWRAANAGMPSSRELSITRWSRSKPTGHSTASFSGASQGPVAPSNRIEGIDVLRGLALVGVLAINIVFEFRVSIFEQFLSPAGTLSAIDRALRDLLAAAIELKALALFSFLFGVGLAIQFDRLANNPRRLTLLVRRLVVLLAIGAAHLFLLFNGDILVEYAVVGLVVLPFLFGPRWLALLVAVASLVLFLTMPVQLPSRFWIGERIAQATMAYADGGFLDVLAFRIREIPAIFPLHVLIFPRTIALFLFGVLAWRSGILRRASEHKSLILASQWVGCCSAVRSPSRCNGEIYTVGRRLDVLTKWRIGLAGSFWPPAMLQASSALQAFPLGKGCLRGPHRSAERHSRTISANPSSWGGFSMATVLDCSAS